MLSARPPARPAFSTKYWRRGGIKVKGNITGSGEPNYAILGGN
ncbi:MAG: hypothetical protein ACTSWM_10500 [Alphaproteobacteria bacterium]